MFGSLAHGDARVDSDVDLAIEANTASDFSLITLGSVAADIEEWLDRGVDLGERSMLRPSLRTAFERDAVRVFWTLTAAVARAPDERLQDMRIAIDRIKRAVAG